MGFLIGFYCLVMFPWGGALMGPIPGLLLGLFRYSQDRILTPLQPLRAGSLTVVLLRLGVLLNLLVLHGVFAARFLVKMKRGLPSSLRAAP
jgi:hypothetical protein